MAAFAEGCRFIAFIIQTASSGSAAIQLVWNTEGDKKELGGHLLTFAAGSVALGTRLKARATRIALCETGPAIRRAEEALPDALEAWSHTEEGGKYASILESLGGSGRTVLVFSSHPGSPEAELLHATSEAFRSGSATLADLLKRAGQWDTISSYSQTAAESLDRLRRMGRAGLDGAFNLATVTAAIARAVLYRQRAAAPVEDEAAEAPVPAEELGGPCLGEEYELPSIPWGLQLEEWPEAYSGLPRLYVDPVDGKRKPTLRNEVLGRHIGRPYLWYPEGPRAQIPLEFPVLWPIPNPAADEGEPAIIRIPMALSFTTLLQRKRLTEDPEFVAAVGTDLNEEQRAAVDRIVLGTIRIHMPAASIEAIRQEKLRVGA